MPFSHRHGVRVKSLLSSGLVSLHRLVRGVLALLTTLYVYVQRRPDSLLSTLLTLFSLSLGIFFALCSYLFIAHALSRPDHAPLGALLAGAMVFFVTWFCGGIVGDT